MTGVVIFGAGHQGRVALEILQAAGRSVTAFVGKDRAASSEGALASLPVWSEEEFEKAARSGEMEVFVAIGNNDVRLRLSERLRAAGYRLCNAIHPSAVIMGSARLGTGILLCPQAFVGANTIIEDDAVINTKASVDHDSHIGPGAYLAPGIITAGCVRVGRGAFIGIGASLGPNVQVGDGAIVGAGAVVLDSVGASAFVAGVPARFIRRMAPPVDWSAVLARAPGLIREPEE